MMVRTLAVVLLGRGAEATSSTSKLFVTVSVLDLIQIRSRLRSSETTRVESLTTINDLCHMQGKRDDEWDEFYGAMILNCGLIFVYPVYLFLHLSLGTFQLG